MLKLLKRSVLVVWLIIVIFVGFWFGHENTFLESRQTP